MIIGVIGCGSIGKVHIENLLRVGDIKVIAHDSSQDALAFVREKHGLQTFEDVNEMFENGRPEAVFVCTPNHMHIKYARMSLEHGCHVFVEKPISNNMDGIDELSGLAKEKGKIVFVACNMRFHPSIVRIKSLLDARKIGKVYSVRVEYGHYLPNWRPSSDYSKSYSANKAQGGGILLDAIHEFDYLAWMFGEPSELFCFADRLSNLKIDVEDTAEVLMRTKTGMIAELHLDYLQRSKRRSCQVVGSEGTIIWESNGKNPEMSAVRYYSTETGRWETHQETVDPKKMYFDQTVHFVNCLKGEERPISDVKSGKLALEMVLSAKSSAENQKMVRF